MGFSDIVSICIGVSAIIGAGFAIYRGGRSLFSGMRKAMRLVDALTGEPPAPGETEGRPGVLERLKNIEGVKADVLELKAILADVVPRIVALEAQMRPNGGTSLRDALDRTEAAVTAKSD